MASFCRSPLLGLTLLAAVAHPALVPPSPAEAKAHRRHVVPSPPSAEGSEALASYYSRRFDGRRTTSGERHRPDALTAAHPDLPFGTRVRVINLGNLRETVVTINDRCRRRKVQVIDLSRAAAREIGLLRRGRVWVRLIPLVPEAAAEL